MRAPRGVSVMSWACYDFGSTVYSAVVISSYFPLYLTELTGANWSLGVATSGSMLLASLVVPVLGALSDQTGRTKTYLVRTTLGCVFFLLFLYLARNPFILILAFAAACFFFHTCVVFYNSLLPVIAEPKRQGLISGLGIGLGYLGAVVVLPFAHLVDVSLGRPAVFVLTAMVFLFFSIPLFLFVPERHVAAPVRFERPLWAAQWKRVFAVVRGLPRHPALLFFLLGNFLVMEVLNCVLAWFLVAGRELFHPPQEALVTLLMGVNAAAFLAGILNGLLTDRWGAMKTMLLSAGILTLGLVLIASSPSFPAFVTVCLIGGSFAVSGIWAAGRKVVIELAAKEEIGQHFGLYGLTTKISVVASLVFALLADFWGFRAAIWFLLAPAALGWMLLGVSARYASNRA